MWAESALNVPPDIFQFVVLPQCERTKVSPVPTMFVFPVTVNVPPVWLILLTGEPELSPVRIDPVVSELPVARPKTEVPPLCIDNKPEFVTDAPDSKLTVPT